MNVWERASKYTALLVVEYVHELILEVLPLAVLSWIQNGCCSKPLCAFKCTNHWFASISNAAPGTCDVLSYFPLTYCPSPAAECPAYARYTSCSPSPSASKQQPRKPSTRHVRGCLGPTCVTKPSANVSKMIKIQLELQQNTRHSHSTNVMYRKVKLPHVLFNALFYWKNS